MFLNHWDLAVTLQFRRKERPVLVGCGLCFFQGVFGCFERRATVPTTIPEVGSKKYLDSYKPLTCKIVSERAQWAILRFPLAEELHQQRKLSYGRNYSRSQAAHPPQPQLHEGGRSAGLPEPRAQIWNPKAKANWGSLQISGQPLLPRHRRTPTLPCTVAPCAATAASARAAAPAERKCSQLYHAAWRRTRRRAPSAAAVRMTSAGLGWAMEAKPHTMSPFTEQKQNRTLITPAIQFPLLIPNQTSTNKSETLILILILWNKHKWMEALSPHRHSSAAPLPRDECTGSSARSHRTGLWDGRSGGLQR